METIYQILTFVFGGTSVVGTILSIIWWKQTKRLKEAEVKQKEVEAEKGEAEATEIAEKTQADADEAEISRLLTQVDHQQKTIENILTLNSNLTERLSKLNATVDKHIDRNRELSDRLYKSETDKNRLNERIITLTEERDEAIRKAEYDKLWRCERTDCQDPRGPRPPRDKLKGLKYNLPEKA